MVNQWKGSLVDVKPMIKQQISKVYYQQAPSLSATFFIKSWNKYNMLTTQIVFLS